MEKIKISREYVREKLLENAKEESVADKERHKKIINSKQEIIGVSMSSVRNIARDVLKNDFYMFLIESSEVPATHEYYEETVIQGIVIAGAKDLDFQIENFGWWAKKIDNWATCDTTVSSMKFLKKNPNKANYFDFFYNLCFSAEEFVSRFGIITLMSCYLEKEYIDKILIMAQSVTNEAYYVQMGLAWLLSFCFMKFRDKTYAVLESRVLSKFVQNKTISKCRDSYQVSNEDKEKLKSLRK